MGSAKLTVPASIDTDGQGWLRLTELAQSQVGTVVYNTAFSREEGLQITFEYAIHGGTGGDGMAFYLIDGSTATPTLGYHSSTLGYTLAGPQPGVTNGYVGIGLQTYADFSRAHLGQGCVATCGPNAQGVAVRGAGSLNSGFPLLAAVSLASKGLGTISTGSRADARTVRITISPVSSAAPYPKVTVEMYDPVTSDFVKVIDALDLSNNGPVPATFKMGFSAATGGLYEYHEVHIKSAKTLVSAVPTLEQNALDALAVLLALLTVPALRRRFRN
jgi:hypothetical protein